MKTESVSRRQLSWTDTEPEPKQKAGRVRCAPNVTAEAIAKQIIYERPYDQYVKPWELEPPIFLGQELTQAIFERNDATPELLYCQSEAIALGLAEHPRADGKTAPLVPKFGMDGDERKAMSKEIKKRKKKAAEEAAKLAWK